MMNTKNSMIASLLLSCIVAATALPSTISWDDFDRLERYGFDEFAADFEKTYADMAEYQHRKMVFKQNLVKILNHNRGQKLLEMSNKKGGFVMGIGPFLDLEAYEIPRGFDKHQQWRLNYLSGRSKKDEVSEKGRRLTEDEILSHMSIDPVSSLPASVDWRRLGVTTAVKSQGQCGSCWAFASTAVLESHVAIQTDILFDLSTQEMTSCVPNPQHCGGDGGCRGSTSEVAYDWISKHGVVQEWDFGYASFHGQQVNCSLAVKVKDDSFLYKNAVATISGYIKLPTNNYNVLMNAVAKLGPVAVSVACMPWQFYKSGVFYHALDTAQATDLDHLVVLEGYGTDHSTGEDYWLVRNSWGPLWGEKGYVRLLRRDPSTLDDPEDDCGMDTTPGDGVACFYDEDGNEIVPDPEKICGTSGILFDSTIPRGGALA